MDLIRHDDWLGSSCLIGVDSEGSCTHVCFSACVSRATVRQGEDRFVCQLSSSEKQHGALPHLGSPPQQREEQD